MSPALKYARPTPGPWIVKALAGHVFELSKLLIMAPSGAPIACVAAQPGQMAPNARLLASAPTLLGFVQAVAGKGVSRAELRTAARALLLQVDVPGQAPEPPGAPPRGLRDQLTEIVKTRTKGPTRARRPASQSDGSNSDR